MCILQESDFNDNVYILTPERERELKKEAREDYYRRQRSMIARFRDAAKKSIEFADTYEDINPDEAQQARSNANYATFNADLLEDLLKKDLQLDEREEIIFQQNSTLAQKESVIEEQTRIIESLKARLNAYGIPYIE